MTKSKSTTQIIFIEIPGAVGYDAGSDGHIYSRRVPFYGGINSERLRLKEKIDKYGYPEVSIYFGKHKKSFKVHALILLAFKGPCSWRHVDQRH
jgi:hypothetical protein